MTLIFLLLSLFLPMLAQGDFTIYTDSNLAAVLRLDGNGRFASAHYASAGGEIVTIRAESADGSLDLVLELLDADGNSLAYADAPEQTAPEIFRIALDSAGVYTVRANTFNGEGVGELTVTIIRDTPYIVTPETTSLRIPLGANETVEIAFEGFGDSGTPYDIVVRDPRGLIDPYLVLVNGDGGVLAVNDDHNTPDPAINRFDSRLVTALSDDARLRITEFLGRPGWLELLINP